MHQILFIIGNVGRDPEMRFTPSGQAVTSFSVATNNQYTDKNGEKVKETTWFRVSVWGKMAEICKEHLKKGSLVYVEGRLVPDKLTGGPRLFTKQDGTQSATFEVSANLVKFLGKNSDSSVATSTESQSVAEDEFPF